MASEGPPPPMPNMEGMTDQQIYMCAVSHGG